MQPEREKKPALRLLDLACSTLWAMESEWLPVILDILNRENDTIEAIEARLGRRLDNTRTVTTRDGIAMIPVVGPLVRYADDFENISGATSVETLAQDFNVALNDPNVRGIIMTFNTPGGQVEGISEFADMVRAAVGVKPMAGYIERASSAGYWIAAALPFLQINDTAHAGNIGIVFATGNPAAKTGPPKQIEIVSEESPLKRVDVTTEAGQSLLRRYANETFDVFANRVAQFRGVSRETVVRDFGQGANRIGADAVKFKMADRVGSLEALRADMKQNPKRFESMARTESEEIEMTLIEKIRALVNGEPSEPSKAAEEPKADTPDATALAEENAKLKEQLASHQAVVQAAMDEAKKREAEAEAQRVDAAVKSFMTEHGANMGKALYDVVESAYRKAEEAKDAGRIAEITAIVKAVPPVGQQDRVKAGGEKVDREVAKVAGDVANDPDAELDAKTRERASKDGISYAAALARITQEGREAKDGTV